MKRLAATLVVLGLACGGCGVDSQSPGELSSAGSSNEELCWFWCSSYTETRYPIVLAHGFLGFDELTHFTVLDWFP